MGICLGKIITHFAQYTLGCLNDQQTLKNKPNIHEPQRSQQIISFCIERERNCSGTRLTVSKDSSTLGERAEKNTLAYNRNKYHI